MLAFPKESRMPDVQLDLQLAARVIPQEEAGRNNSPQKEVSSSAAVDSHDDAIRTI